MHLKLIPLAAVFAASLSTPAAQKDEAVYTTPEAAASEPGFLLQGEYAGTIPNPNGDISVGVQVIALGDDKFRAVGFEGGLPGAGWDGSDKEISEASLENGKVVFKKPDSELSGVLADGTVQVMNGATPVAVLSKVNRESPTLGKTPPQGATVLFDGSGVEAWKNGKMTEDGLLQQGTTSQQLFGSPFHLHLEFRLPYKPHARGQGRGNSGVYMQGRYETQVLDSFGLSGEHNECGGIYSIKKPDVNMCFPPLAWQTYDIDFTPAKFDTNGKKTDHAKMSVKHNGIQIHKDVPLPKSTTAAPLKESDSPGPIYIQDHGNPVQFRNIWIVEKS